MYTKQLLFAFMAPLSMAASDHNNQPTKEKDPIIGYVFVNPNFLENIRFNKPPKGPLNITFSDPNELIKELAPYEPIVDEKDLFAIRDFTIDAEFKEIFNFKNQSQEQKKLNASHHAINTAMHQELAQTLRIKNPSIPCVPRVRKTPYYELNKKFDDNTEYFENVVPAVAVAPDIAALIPRDKLAKLIDIEKQMSENVVTMNKFMKTETYKLARNRGTMNDFADPRAITRKDVQL